MNPSLSPSLHWFFLESTPIYTVLVYLSLFDRNPQCMPRHTRNIAWGKLKLNNRTIMTKHCFPKQLSKRSDWLGYSACHRNRRCLVPVCSQIKKNDRVLEKYKYKDGMYAKADDKIDVDQFSNQEGSLPICLSRCNHFNIENQCNKKHQHWNS